jgi:hypothetical protein
MKLLQAVRNQASRIAADLEDSKLFTHMGDRGSFREVIIQRFLRPFLAECYGLSAGEVFSSDGTQSAQVDIVIFDAVFSTVLFKDGPTRLFPAESIFGSIEIKSNLTAHELDLSCRNVVSVKQLQRATSDMLDFLPFVRLNAGSEFGWDHTPSNPYIGMIFAYDGIAKETVAAQLYQRLVADPINKQTLPDFVFVARPGYLVARCNQTEAGIKFTLPGGEFNRFGYLDTGPDTLPLFYLALNICLNRIRLRTVDHQALWGQLISESVGRAKFNDC